MPGGNLSGDGERPCCWHLFDIVKHLCSVSLLFFVNIHAGFCGYFWHVSSLSRNHTMHSLHGNGSARKGTKGKGKSKQSAPTGQHTVPSSHVATSSDTPYGSGKGKGSAEPPVDLTIQTTQLALQAQEARLEAEKDFREQMLAVLPSHLHTASPQLVAEEWNTKIVAAHELTAHGGVALVNKKDIPSVVARVGQTTRPTAIVTSQPASELYMGGAPCKEIFCSLMVSTDSGLSKVLVRRFLIQLGIAANAQVTMETANLTSVKESLTMCKIVLRFNALGGWDPKLLRSIIVSDYLKQFMPESAFSNIVVREDGSATTLVHDSKVADVLKNSGIAHVYCKPHVDVSEWQSMEILWLPHTVAHAEALSLARAHASALGLAIKQNQEVIRFGLRFRHLVDLEKVASEIGMAPEAKLGRFKVTAVADAVGAAGVLNMMASIGWQIEEVLFVGEGHAIVSAQDCPNTNKYKLERHNGMNVPMWVHAVNSRARQMFKSKNISFRNTDGEGEDVTMTDDSKPEAVPGKIKAASALAADRSKEQQSLRRPRTPTGHTPSKDAKARASEPPGTLASGAPSQPAS